jgi:hypothetical protein
MFSRAYTSYSTFTNEELAFTVALALWYVHALPAMHDWLPHSLTQAHQERLLLNADYAHLWSTLPSQMEVH